MKAPKKQAKFLFGEADSEHVSARSALDYLSEWSESQDLVVGQEVEITRFQRKAFSVEVFEAALAFAWDRILTALDDEYSVDDPIGLEDCEDDFVKGGAKLLLQLAKTNAVPYQCVAAGVQTWRWDGKRWVRKQMMTLKQAVDQANAELGKDASTLALLARAEELVSGTKKATT